ncbi:MAG: glycogen synthase [Parachlamydiales bacterium]
MSHIVHIATELAPIAKVGGLGDVLLGLSREHASMGHEVSVVLPKYASLKETPIEGLAPLPELPAARLWSGRYEGLTLYLIDPISGVFNRREIYGCPDDGERFLSFCQAAVALIKRLHPDVIHLHDWMTAPCAPLCLQEGMAAPVVTTIHNLEHQGRFPPSLLEGSGLNPHDLLDPRDQSRINFLKGALLFSHWLTTVSPTYAREILTPEYGFGLDGVLGQVADRTTGILNALDLKAWNPQNDPYLPAPFSREESRRALQRELGMAERKGFMVGCVARLVPQKGLELIERALIRTVESGGQFVLLGTTSDQGIRDHFEWLKGRFQGSGDVHLHLEQDEGIVHRIYAACDLFIVPSRYEPCGLTQQIAMRYGSVPLVRATGGLADTVFDADTSDRPNGFLFPDYSVESFDRAFDRALTCYQQEPQRWEALITAGMAVTQGWAEPAKAYLEVYRRATLLASAGAELATGSQG